MQEEAIVRAVEATRPSHAWSKIVLAGVVLLLVVSIGVIGYFGIGPALLQPAASMGDSSTSQDANALVHPSVSPTAAPQALVTVAATNAQLQPLLTALAQQIRLPASELPTVQAVVDPSRLSTQPFFAASQQDDLVLLFAQAKLVLLYRPSTGKVVNQGTLSDGASASASGVTHP